MSVRWRRPEALDQFGRRLVRAHARVDFAQHEPQPLLCSEGSHTGQRIGSISSGTQTIRTASLTGHCIVPPLRSDRSIGRSVDRSIDQADQSVEAMCAAGLLRHIPARRGTPVGECRNGISMTIACGAGSLADSNNRRRTCAPQSDAMHCDANRRRKTRYSTSAHVSLRLGLTAVRAECCKVVQFRCTATEPQRI